MHLFKVILKITFYSLIFSSATWGNSALQVTVDIKKAPIFPTLDKATLETLQKKNTPLYWVCSKKNLASINLHCEDLGINEGEGAKADLEIHLETSATFHEYGLRHGISAKECRSLKKSILTLVQSSNDLCILGNYIALNQYSDTIKVDWVFYELKTDKGRVCDLCL